MRRRRDNRVVLTHKTMGLWTPIGYSVSEFEANLFAGKCGITELTRFREMEIEEGQYDEFPVKVAGQVKEPEFRIAKKQQLKGAGRFARYAIAAAEQALSECIFRCGDDPKMTGVLIGNGSGGREEAEKAQRDVVQKGLFKRCNEIDLRTINKVTASSPSAKISQIFKWPLKCDNGHHSSVLFEMFGDNFGITSACASSVHSMGEAFHKVRDGYLEVVVTGGTEASLTPTSVGPFGWLEAPSFSADPNRASIAFDAERSGFVMGEGAGIFVFETLEHVLNRGAESDIICEVVGYGAASDSYKSDTAPHPQGRGLLYAMEKALDDAEMVPSDIGFIEAHGTGTLLNDKIETIAVKTLYQDSPGKIPPMSSVKTQVGHAVGAAGAMGFAAAVLALKNKKLPPTINYRVPDPECDLDYVTEGARDAPKLKAAMANALAFGGLAASIIVREYKGAN